MNLLRRSFLKKTLAASATGMLASRLSAAPAGPAQEFYELRCYHLKADSRIKADANPALLDDYLEHAFLPALRKLGVKNTGIFTEIEVDKKTGSRAPKRDSPVGRAQRGSCGAESRGRLLEGSEGGSRVRADRQLADACVCRHAPSQCSGFF